MKTRRIATSDTHEPTDIRADSTLDRYLPVHLKGIWVGGHRQEVG